MCCAVFSGEMNEASSMLQRSRHHHVPTRYSAVHHSTVDPTFTHAQYIPYCDNMAMYLNSGSSSFSSSVSSGYSYPMMDEQTSDNLKTLNTIAGLETRMKPSNTPVRLIHSIIVAIIMLIHSIVKSMWCSLLD